MFPAAWGPFYFFGWCLVHTSSPVAPMSTAARRSHVIPHPREASERCSDRCSLSEPGLRWAGVDGIPKAWPRAAAHEDSPFCPKQRPPCGSVGGETPAHFWRSSLRLPTLYFWTTVYSVPFLPKLTERSNTEVLGGPKSSLGFFCNLLRKTRTNFLTNPIYSGQHQVKRRDYRRFNQTQIQ